MSDYVLPSWYSPVPVPADPRPAVAAIEQTERVLEPIERAEQDVLDTLERWSPFHLAVAFFELQRRGWNRQTAETERLKARRRGAVR